MAKKSRKDVTDDGQGDGGAALLTPLAEVIMCQMTYALGTGADMWICTDAIDWFRQMYYDDVKGLSLPAWRREATNVLELCRKIGRRAAWIALSKAKMHIGLKSLDQAIGDIMASIPRDLRGGPSRGPACANFDQRREKIGFPRTATD